MLTLDEAIEHAEDIAISAIGCECREEHRQLAAWLCELQERRKAPEIVYCKDCRKHNVKVGFDENFHTVWKEDACPLVDWRGKAKEHEFDYQYCAFAERRTDD
jgi:hypothetical protein